MQICGFCEILLSILLYQTCVAYNILGVFPTFSKSHYIAGGALMRSLAADGHNVSVISPYPNETPLPNFTDIRVLGIEDAVKVILPSPMHLRKSGAIEGLAQIYQLSFFITNYTLHHPVMTEFLANKGNRFDLIIVEATVTETLYGLGQHFNAPVIVFSPFGFSRSVASLIGSPVLISYVPHLFLSYTDRMSFKQRLVNAVVNLIEYSSTCIQLKYQEDVFRKHFPNQESVYAARKSIALVLINQHFSTNTPRPYAPNMIEVGGIHINRKRPKELPKDIRIFIDGAENGVIYFSLGSNMRSSELPPEIRADILSTLSRLKQRVLWKWEQTELPGKPENVMIKSWFPQDDILANPKIKVFITHGGLLGLSEAVYHGLPVIGIPFFADQVLNMARAESQGYGLTITYSNLTRQSLTWALVEMLGNSKYSEQAKAMSILYRDQPMPPMKVAKYWVEYVARHKGAPHMQSASLELSMLQYYSLDVFVVLALTPVVILYLSWLALVVICRSTRRILAKPPTTIKQSEAVLKKKRK